MNSVNARQVVKSLYLDYEMKAINHITQSKWNSCTSAAIAMLLGHKDDEEIWKEFGQYYVKSVDSTTPLKEYMMNKGLRLDCYTSNITHSKSLELGRVCLVTVPSLNIDGGLHSIVWDGRSYEGNKYIYDPNEGREGRRYYIAQFDNYTPIGNEVVLNGFFVDCEILKGGVLG